MGSIPTVAKVFVPMGQRNEKNNTKRAADTEVIMNEIHDRKAGSDAQLSGLARMNYVRSRYGKAGKIREEDVKSLGTAVSDIFRSIEHYEWRRLTEVEKCAVGVFHKALREAMDIPLELLPPHKTGWLMGSILPMSL
ncbi:hypothetical protein BDV29DRAFT_181421 [Aspergillus leporis]|jgi:hypothetical protein|uniref:Uncharacterized protein n=1 Tax=Aspergillus leporis TaxID=41062 RepID=A0A5N5WQV4_9EURO|nr:hypothetical protein BDV29DRAFT_181421 [Aspergillus leporis]